MRDILSSPRVTEIKHNRLIRKLRLSILLIILFVTIVGALGYFSAYPRITISAVVVTGNLTINADDIKSRANDELSGRYFYLFSRLNTLIYPRMQIYNDLMKAFPRIEKLFVYHDNWNTLHIAMTEKSSSYLYCGGQIPALENIGENCYFVDNNGLIFDKAPYFSGNVYFKYYTALLDNTDPIGQQIIDRDRFHYISDFVNQITTLGFKPICLIINGDGTSTLYLDHGVNDTSPYVIFNSDDNLSVIFGNFSTAMTKPEFANDINSKYATLLYIDLRFKDKVLYKFK